MVHLRAQGDIALTGFRLAHIASTAIAMTHDPSIYQLVPLRPPAGAPTTAAGRAPSETVTSTEAGLSIDAIAAAKATIRSAYAPPPARAVAPTIPPAVPALEGSVAAAMPLAGLDLNISQPGAALRRPLDQLALLRAPGETDGGEAEGEVNDMVLHKLETVLATVRWKEDKFAE
jgi:hypothetical protein